MGQRTTSSVKHVRKILIFLYLFVQCLSAEGQLFESLFSKRSSDDGGQSGFVEDTSKHFLSMLFTPFNNKQQYEGDGGGGMFTSLLSPARSGPANYDSYRNAASQQKPSSSSYTQAYGRSNGDYYACEGCGGPPPPPVPSRQVSPSASGADYTCTGCDKHPTEPKPPPAFVDYSCKGCNENTQRSSARLQEYHPASTTYNEHYQSPKIYHEVLGLRKRPQYSVIDTRLRIPPVKFRFHINPKITITTNTQDPLAKQHHHHADDDDYLPPPELHPNPHLPPPELHHHPHHHVHGYHHHHHHTSRQSHDHSNDHQHYHHEEPYGAQITKHEQPIRNTYERSFAIKLNPEIHTDPPPTRRPRTTTARPRSTTAARSSRTAAPREISPRLESASPTQRTTTTTTRASLPSASSDTRASLDGLREAAESGLSPLEVLLARRRTSTTTTTTTTVSPTTTHQSASSPETTSQQREVEEITVKSTTEAASNNEIVTRKISAAMEIEKLIEETTARPTRDPKATLAKLREAADAGLSPLEVLLSRGSSNSNAEKKLNPRRAEAN